MDMWTAPSWENREISSFLWTFGTFYRRICEKMYWIYAKSLSFSHTSARHIKKKGKTVLKLTNLP